MTRYQVTNWVLKQLGTDHDWALDRALFEWWMGHKDYEPLRLTIRGHSILTQWIKNWHIDITGTTITSKRLIQLSRLPCPYYIHDNSHKKLLYVYSGQIAMTLRLYSDVEQWLDSL